MGVTSKRVHDFNENNTHSGNAVNGKPKVEHHHLRSIKANLAGKSAIWMMNFKEPRQFNRMVVRMVVGMFLYCIVALVLSRH